MPKQAKGEPLNELMSRYAQGKRDRKPSDLKQRLDGAYHQRKRDAR